MALYKLKDFEIKAWKYEGDVKTAPDWVSDFLVTSENNVKFVFKNSKKESISITLTEGFWVVQYPDDFLFGPNSTTVVSPNIFENNFIEI